MSTFAGPETRYCGGSSSAPYAVVAEDPTNRLDALNAQAHHDATTTVPVGWKVVREVVTVTITVSYEIQEEQ